MAGLKEDTAIGIMMKKDATNRLGSIDPCSLINTRNFITVVVFTVLIKTHVLAS